MTSQAYGTAQNDALRGLQMAQAVMDKAKAPGTIRNYKSNLRVLARWMEKRGVGTVSAETHLPTCPIDDDVLISFFGELTNPNVEPSDGRHPVMGRLKGKTKLNGGHVQPTTVSGYRSAITWLYEQNGLDGIQPELRRSVKKIHTGYRKVVGALRQEGIMSTTEGKRPLSYAGYRMLAMKFLLMRPTVTPGGNHRGINTATTWAEGVFAWAYLVLQWNVMSRSENMGGAKLSHISWQDDHLLITLCKTKTDQEADDVLPKSVFANPLDPSICPVLALAMMILCRQYVALDNVNPRLFDGAAQEDR